MALQDILELWVCFGFKTWKGEIFEAKPSHFALDRRSMNLLRDSSDIPTLESVGTHMLCGTKLTSEPYCGQETQYLHSVI